MRCFFEQEMKRKPPWGLILASHPLCFRVICWPNPRLVWSQPSDCCSISNTHTQSQRWRCRREGGQGGVESFSELSWLLRGEGNHREINTNKSQRAPTSYIRPDKLTGRCTHSPTFACSSCTFPFSHGTFDLIEGGAQVQQIMQS